MNILVIQETDWLTRGPHIQHHIFERLSKNINFKIFVLDYDIDKIERSKSVFIKRKVYKNIKKTIRDSKIEVIRTSHLRIPFLRRISSIITNFFEILKIFRKNRPNIIVGYSISNGFIGLLISKLFSVPYVFHYIDFLHSLVPIKYAQNIARITARIIFKFADVVIVHTDLQSKYIIDEGANPKRIRFLPIGASLDNIGVDQEEINKIRENLSIKKNEFILFFMGYLYEFAGLIEIIDYYNQKVKNDHYKFKFHSLPFILLSIIYVSFLLYSSIFHMINLYSPIWILGAFSIIFISTLTSFLQLWNDKDCKNFIINIFNIFRRSSNSD